MNILVNQIFENKEAAALPGLLESGGLPALVSGLSAVHRANLGAALRSRLGAPVSADGVYVCCGAAAGLSACCRGRVRR